MSLPTLGVKFSTVPQLRRVRDLEAFEAPILSELRGSAGSLYLEKWCARDDQTTRTLVVRSEQRAVAEYLGSRSTLLSLLTRPNDDIGFLVDRNRAKKTSSAQLVVVSELPEKYLPTPTAMHDESLRPDWARTDQSFLLDAPWNGKLLADIEKLYTDVYAFNYFTDRRQLQPKKLTANLITGMYDSGWSYYRAFVNLRKRVPLEDQARMEGVAMASPGVVTLSVPSGMDGRIASALSAAARENTVKYYRVLHDWSRYKHKNAAKLPPTAAADLERLCSALGVRERSILPVEAPGKPELLIAGKLIAAYCRRLWGLLDPPWDGVEFLAPGVDRGVFQPPIPTQDDYDDDEDIPF